MRILVALVSAVGVLFGVAGQAHADQTMYVTLNKQGLMQAQITKSDVPSWLFPTSSTRGTVKKEAPVLCSTKTDVELEGPKAPMVGFTEIDLQAATNDYSNIGEELFQYSDTSSAANAWKGVRSSMKKCAGSWTHDYLDAKEQVVESVTTNIEVRKLRPFVDSNIWIITEDVQTTKPLPSGAVKKWSSDEVSAWGLVGNAIIEIEFLKYVDGSNAWNFTPGEEAQVRVLFKKAAKKYQNLAVESL